MKAFFTSIVAPCVLIICLLVGCSDDDAAERVQEEEFLSAQIDGEDFMVDGSGVISCQKYLNDYGGIDLLVNVETEDGEHMEFYIADYTGAKNYAIGNNVFNKSSMKYGIMNPLGDWFASAETKQAQTNIPYLEIIEDTGDYIKGNFEFDAHNTVDNSSKVISNGDFNFRVATELD